MKKFILSALWMVLLTAGLGFTSYAGPLGSPSFDGGLLYGTGGEVTVYFWYSEAAFDSYLWLDLGSEVEGAGTVFGPMFHNHGTTPGALLSLGIIPANTPLPFRLQVTTLPNNWYVGPAASNADGNIHSAISRWAKDGAIGQDGYLVGFEDLPGESDFDYNDFEFVVSGVTDNPVPEPATFVLFGSALVAVGVVQLRRKRQRSL